jgi:hypothetical protein
MLNSRIQDADEIVDVVFESVGLKKLAASLANLAILWPADGHPAARSLPKEY